MLSIKIIACKGLRITANNTPDSVSTWFIGTQHLLDSFVLGGRLYAF